MTQYIDKDALVAEIDRRILEDYSTDDVEMDEVAQGVLASFKYFIDTLEVKEVDLEKEIKKYIENNICGYCVPGVEETAKYFFELGLKAKGE